MRLAQESTPAFTAACVTGLVVVFAAGGEVAGEVALELASPGAVPELKEESIRTTATRRGKAPTTMVDRKLVPILFPRYLASAFK